MYIPPTLFRCLNPKPYSSSSFLHTRKSFHLSYVEKLCAAVEKV